MLLFFIKFWYFERKGNFFCCKTKVIRLEEKIFCIKFSRMCRNFVGREGNEMERKDSIKSINSLKDDGILNWNIFGCVRSFSQIFRLINHIPLITFFSQLSSSSNHKIKWNWWRKGMMTHHISPENNNLFSLGTHNNLLSFHFHFQLIWFPQSHVMWLN